MVFRLAQSLMTVQRAWYPSTHIVPLIPFTRLRPSYHSILYHTCCRLPWNFLCPGNGIVEEGIENGQIVTRSWSLGATFSPRLALNPCKFVMKYVSGLPTLLTREAFQHRKIKDPRNFGAICTRYLDEHAPPRLHKFGPKR